MAITKALVLTTVLSVRDGALFYPCCAQCYRKLLVNTDDARHWCPRCNQSFSPQRVQYRYRLCMKVTDGKTVSEVTAFGKTVEGMMGISATDLNRYVEDLQNQLPDWLSADQLLHESVQACFVGSQLMLGFRTTPFHKSESQNERHSPITLRQIVSHNPMQGTRTNTNWVDSAYSDVIVYQVVQDCESKAKVTVIEYLKEKISRILGIQESKKDVENLENYTNGFDDSRIASQSSQNTRDSDCSSQFTICSEDHTDSSAGVSYGQSTVMISCYGDDESSATMSSFNKIDTSLNHSDQVSESEIETLNTSDSDSILLLACNNEPYSSNAKLKMQSTSDYCEHLGNEQDNSTLRNVGSIDSSLEKQSASKMILLLDDTYMSQPQTLRTQLLKTQSQNTVSMIEMMRDGNMIDPYSTPLHESFYKSGSDSILQFVEDVNARNESIGKHSFHEIESLNESKKEIELKNETSRSQQFLWVDREEMPESEDLDAFLAEFDYNQHWDNSLPDNHPLPALKLKDSVPTSSSDENLKSTGCACVSRNDMNVVDSDEILTENVSAEKTMLSVKINFEKMQAIQDRGEHIESNSNKDNFPIFESQNSNFSHSQEFELPLTNIENTAEKCSISEACLPEHSFDMFETTPDLFESSELSSGANDNSRCSSLHSEDLDDVISPSQNIVSNNFRQVTKSDNCVRKIRCKLTKQALQENQRPVANKQNSEISRDDSKENVSGNSYTSLAESDLIPPSLPVHQHKETSDSQVMSNEMPREALGMKSNIQRQVSVEECNGDGIRAKTVIDTEKQGIDQVTVKKQRRKSVHFSKRLSSICTLQEMDIQMAESPAREMINDTMKSCLKRKQSSAWLCAVDSDIDKLAKNTTENAKVLSCKKSAKPSILKTVKDAVHTFKGSFDSDNKENTHEIVPDVQNGKTSNKAKEDDRKMKTPSEMNEKFVIPHRDASYSNNTYSCDIECDESKDLFSPSPIINVAAFGTRKLTSSSRFESTPNIMFDKGKLTLSERYSSNINKSLVSPSMMIFNGKIQPGHSIQMALQQEKMEKEDMSDELFSGDGTSILSQSIIESDSEVIPGTQTVPQKVNKIIENSGNEDGDSYNQLDDIRKKLF